MRGFPDVSKNEWVLVHSNLVVPSCTYAAELFRAIYLKPLLFRPGQYLDNFRTIRDATPRVLGSIQVLRTPRGLPRRSTQTRALNPKRNNVYYFAHKSPAGYTVPRNSGTRHFNPYSRVVMSGQEASMGNTQTAKAQAQGSQSQLHVGVTGTYLSRSQLVHAALISI